MDTLKKIVHLKNFFEACPSNDRFLEEKEWIIEVYLSCFAELVEAHRVREGQAIMIERMKEHIEASLVNIRPQANQRREDDDHGYSKKSKQIWIKKTKVKNTDSKN